MEHFCYCCKNQKICNKAVDTYSSAIQFVPCWYKTHEMCNKGDDTCIFAFGTVPAWYKTYKICDTVVFEEPFILKYCLHRYKTQEMYDKAVDAFLPTLKFVPDWFVTNKMLENFYDVVFSNDDMVFFCWWRFWFCHIFLVMAWTLIF